MDSIDNLLQLVDTKRTTIADSLARLVEPVRSGNCDFRTIHLQDSASKRYVVVSANRK